MNRIVSTLCGPKWFVAFLIVPTAATVLAFLQTIEYAQARNIITPALVTVSSGQDYATLVMSRLRWALLIPMSALLFVPFLVPFLVERLPASSRAKGQRSFTWLFRKVVVPGVAITLALAAVQQFGLGRDAQFWNVSGAGLVFTGLFWAVHLVFQRWKGGAIEAVGRMSLATLAGITVAICVGITTAYRLPTMNSEIVAGLWKDLAIIGVIYLLLISIGTWIAIAFSSPKKPRPPSIGSVAAPLALLAFLVLLAVAGINAELEWINRGFAFTAESIYGRLNEVQIAALWRLQNQHVMARSVITLLLGVVFTVAGGSLIKILAFVAWANADIRRSARQKAPPVEEA